MLMFFFILPKMSVSNGPDKAGMFEQYLCKCDFPSLRVTFYNVLKSRLCLKISKKTVVVSPAVTGRVTLVEPGSGGMNIL